MQVSKVLVKETKLDVRKINRRWNRVLMMIEATERAWGDLQEDLVGVAREELELTHPRTQKGLAIFGRGELWLVLPKMVRYFKSQGGIKELKVPQDEMGKGR